MSALPGGPEIAMHDGTLFVEQLAVAGLARRFGTPLYVYSQASMQRALSAYQSALRGRDHLICYAIKANSTLAVLQWFASQGCGFDIVSAGELERVLAAGGDPARVVFSGVGKTRAEMARALEVGVMCFNVESIGELEVLSAVAAANGRVARVSLRVNPDVDPKTHPYISTGLRGNKFGIAHEDAATAFVHAASLPAIEVAGIDCFALTRRDSAISCAFFASLTASNVSPAFGTSVRPRISTGVDGPATVTERPASSVIARTLPTAGPLNKKSPVRRVPSVMMTRATGPLPRSSKASTTTPCAGFFGLARSSMISAWSASISSRLSTPWRVFAETST